MVTKQLAMVVDASKCIDCKACMASCKTANNVPEGFWRNWIVAEDMETAAEARRPLKFQPGNCMHCTEAICVQACPTGATYKNETDGTVLINHRLCIGCGQCLPACPYGARFRNPVLKMADKCDFCAQRRAVGLDPACVTTCPTKARVFGDLNDPADEVYHLVRQNPVRQVVNPKTNTDPNIYYVGDPGVKDWPIAAKMPSAFSFWKNWAGPIANGVVILSALGVGAMFVKQLVMPHDEPLDEADRDREEGGHE
jgi:tetrathionate reductase subunit B